MARPVKEGMDYFPHDTDAVNDEKLEALRAIYGNDGYAFYFIMLERIYRSKNFELDISDAEIKEETFQILANKVAVSKDKFEQILNTAFKWGCFSREWYDERGVISSEGIKKRAGAVIDKRQKMRDKYEKSKADISDAETKEETEEETPQSKEKKSKEKKSIYINIQHLPLYLDEYEKLIELYGKDTVDEKIDYAQNYAKLKNYKSAYRTLFNWLKSDSQGKPSTKTEGPLGLPPCESVLGEREEEWM